MIRIGIYLSAFVAALSTIGCAPKPLPPLTLDTTGVTPAVDYNGLANILKHAVSENGRFSQVGLKKRADTLEKQLKLLAVTGPTVTPKLFPTREDRLAYWYNARAAWVLKLASLCDSPKKNVPPDHQPACMFQRAFPLDGREMTLTLIDRAIEAEGGWMAVVASPSVSRRRAKMPTKPFTAEKIDATVKQRFNEFIDDKNRFVIDILNQTILVPPVLWQYRDQLIYHYNHCYRTTGANFITAMLPYVHGSALRRLQDAIGYRTVCSNRRLILDLQKED